MRDRLLIQTSFHLREQLIEFFRFNDRPRNDVQFTSMQTSDEVRLLFILHDLLEFKRKLSAYFYLVCLDDILDDDH